MELTKSDIRTLVKVLNAFAGTENGYIALDTLDSYKNYYIAVLNHLEKESKKNKEQNNKKDTSFEKMMEQMREDILAEYKISGTREIVKLIFLLSQKYVPVDTGYLRDSGWIEYHNDIYTIHYDAPYAAKQHETLGYNHTYPGRAKYLENAAYEVLNWLSDKKPLFTFELGLGDTNDDDPDDQGGNIWLDINSIDAEEFIRNNEVRERIRAFGFEDLEVIINDNRSPTI